MLLAVDYIVFVDGLVADLAAADAAADWFFGFLLNGLAEVGFEIAG